MSSNEMLWKPDANVDAARLLPEWARFHRLCGEHDLYHDRAERVGKEYRTVTYTVEYEPPAPQRYRIRRFIYLSTGTGKTVLDSIIAAFNAANFPVPGAREMLARGLTGAPTEVFDMEELLG